jgi:hypothetical protein
MIEVQSTRELRAHGLFMRAAGEKCLVEEAPKWRTSPVRLEKLETRRRKLEHRPEKEQDTGNWRDW